MSCIPLAIAVKPLSTSVRTWQSQQRHARPRLHFFSPFISRQGKISHLGFGPNVFYRLQKRVVLKMSTASEKDSLPSEKELVPLVEGKQILEADDVAAETSGVVPGPKPIPPAKVQLTAPFDLPPGYKLSIKYHQGGKTVHGFCRVPSGGVYAGDEFEAEIVAPRVITGRWAVGVFDCCGSVRDSAFLAVSFFGSTLAWGCLYESAFQKPSGSCWILLLVMLVLQYVFASMVDPNAEEVEIADVLSNILLLSMTIIVIFIRWKIRQKYQIAGNCCEDCLCVSFCPCCSAMQAYHHMELAQEAPRMGRTVTAMRTPTPKDVVII